MIKCEGDVEHRGIRKEKHWKDRPVLAMIPHCRD